MALNKLHIVLMALVAHFVCTAHADTDQNQQELGIVLLGDQGKNNDGQRSVSNALTRFCSKEQCDAVLLLGDNIYSSGVRSVRDRKFETHFEQHYRDLEIPFWAVLGNHDYGYGLARGNVQAQIDYSKRSTKWRMPARYYQFNIGRIEFIAIDSIALPKDSAQQEWLKQKLANEKTGHRVVFGHYPIHSSGMHGDNAFMSSQVAPLLCGTADIYAAGHDHHLEHAVTDCGVVQIVSGAGAETRPVQRNQKSKFAKASLGFTYLRMNSLGELNIEYIGEKLELLAQFKLQTN
jgi:tartrate-resistant acid phosphatase type 5